MSEHKLASLIGRFRPKRTYQSGNIIAEVDGVFVRVDEDICCDGETILIPVEDMLQDAAVIRSARVSTGRDTAAVSEKAQDLLRSLYQGEHVTPSEGAVLFRLRMTVPIYTAQSFFQIFSSHNEWSGRYSEIDGAFAVPKLAEPSLAALQILRENEWDSKQIYSAFLQENIAKEQARFALSYRFFTRFYWTVSLRHLLELAALEANPYAPAEFWEFRDTVLPALFRDWTPWTSDVFEATKKCYPMRWALDVPSPEIPCLWERAVGNIGTIQLVSSSVDENVIRRGVHTGPNPKRGFGHSSLTFGITCPIFVYRQWVRHRYGVWSELPVDFDEIVKKKDFYIPKTFRKQVGKSMSYEYEDMIGATNERYKHDLALLIQRQCIRYQRLRELDFSPEESAIVLPYVFSVSRLWTVNLEGLMNFFSLRCDTHAQYEIRAYANELYEWFSSAYPWSNEIFLKHLNYGKSPVFDENKK